jgi:hypothetical protein
MTHHRSRAAAIGAMKRALTLTTAALAPTLALVFLVGGHAQDALGAESRAQARETPSATQFAHDFIGVTNKYASQHGDGARLGNAHCVEAAPGKYMCSYLVTAKGVRTCHLMQAQWTPERSSAITVTLAGRTRRCGTLREAIQSLR